MELQVGLGKRGWVRGTAVGMGGNFGALDLQLHMDLYAPGLLIESTDELLIDLR